MGVQTYVNREMPAGYNGDFASANPRFSMLGVENAWRAGSNGVLAGSFVWADEDAGTVGNSGTGAPDGFVRRGGLSIISTIPQSTSVIIPSGTPLTVYEQGDFRMTLPTGVTATRKDAVYVDPTTGLIVASTASGAVATRFTYAQTGVAGDNVMISAYMQQAS